MPYMNWNESLRVGVGIVDEQHKELVRLVNELHDAMTQGQGHARLESTLKGLTDYTVTHFRTEEDYFASLGYDDAASHKREHDSFILQVMDFTKGFEEGTLMLSLDVMSFLGDWLVKHIQGTDRKFAPFFNEHGVL